MRIDPAAFSSRDAELDAINRRIVAFQRDLPDFWTRPVEAVRAARREGRGVFPAPELDPAAETATVHGRNGEAIPVRILRPASRRALGTYLHFHGGGWMFGEAAENDARLRRLAEATGLATLSVDYRLAPEHPFPAGPDDCEDAARALLTGAFPNLPTERLAIGGESAGAHLAVLTLLRLRATGEAGRFARANLVAGCFDLTLTPSVRRFGAERLVLNTADVEQFANGFVPDITRRNDPALSPLFADLKDLPPALFTVGTRDLLLDDTLFMAARWLAAGNEAALSLWPDGCHVFQAFASAAGTRSESEMAAFLGEATAGGDASAAAPRD